MLQLPHWSLLHLQVPEWSTLIGRDSPDPVLSLVFPGAKVYNKWLIFTERSYYRRPYDIKSQSRARNNLFVGDISSQSSW